MLWCHNQWLRAILKEALVWPMIREDIRAHCRMEVYQAWCQLFSKTQSTQYRAVERLLNCLTEESQQTLFDGIVQVEQRASAHILKFNRLVEHNGAQTRTVSL
jgi:hypothetical protein